MAPLTKKRKSDVKLDVAGVEHPPKKPWNVEEEANGRRQSWFGGKVNSMMKRFTSSSTLKDRNRESTSQLEPMDINNITCQSQNSESSVNSSCDSSASLLATSVMANANLRAFINRDSLTPVISRREHFVAPAPPQYKPYDDSTSMSSGNTDVGIDDSVIEDTRSVTSLCTPRRGPLTRGSTGRASSRSVPENYEETALVRGLCNSAVRRAQSTTLDNFSHRRSIRLRGRIGTSMNMQDVPEDDVLDSSQIAQPEASPSAHEEDFVDGPMFFTENATEDGSDRPHTPTSVGRRHSLLKVKTYLFGSGKSKMRDSLPCSLTDSQVAEEDAVDSVAPATRRRTSLTTASGSGVKLRSSAASASNLSMTQRFSAVFKRKDESTTPTNSGLAKNNKIVRRGSSMLKIGRNKMSESMSSGIGSVDTTRELARNASKRQEEMKERTRRFIDSVSVSEKTASELIEENKDRCARRKAAKMSENEEQRMDDSEVDSLFDAVAVDVRHDGKPYSETSAVLVDNDMAARIKAEKVMSFRPDHCGTIADHEPGIVFVCPSLQLPSRDLDDSMTSLSASAPSLLPNVRNGVLKAVDLWNGVGQDQSTILLYPMFCSTEDEWDNAETIESVFKMLDCVLNTKKWKKNGRCILAGVTQNNARLLKERYDALKMSIEESPADASAVVEEDVRSVASDTAVITKM